MDLIGFLLIGLIAGWIATQFMHSGSLGLLGNLAVGVVGAVIGGVLFRLIGFAAIGLIGKLITATVGAIVLLYITRLWKNG